LGEQELVHIGLKVPVDLQRRLLVLAGREANGLSSVCRRLLMTALAREGVSVSEDRSDEQASS